MSGSDDDRSERLATELSLLESIYPDQVKYHSKGGEVSFKSDLGSFMLRLSDEYLHTALPEVIAASAGRVDLRAALKTQIAAQCAVGEEVLDAIIMLFQDVAQQFRRNEAEDREERPSLNAKSSEDSETDEKKATVIVYLHHLLNTNKRKQCTSPPSGISGVTKPGYPGVLVYSGSWRAVHEHVDELKALNWQAFQVRMEAEEEWSFRHGEGVVEVESMGEVVKEIEWERGGEHGGDEEVGKKRKMEFLEAMKMKG